MWNEYFRTKKEIATKPETIPIGTVLYKYHSVKNPECEEDGYEELWFKNVDTNRLAIIIPSKEVPVYLEEMASIDLFLLFRKYAPDILKAMESFQEKWIPNAARYVLQDMRNGDLNRAFAGLESESDKIRDSLLGDELRRHCISI